MRLNAKQIQSYTGGQFLVSPLDARELMTGISWDSRTIEPGWLYVALVGERVDGHSFVGRALRAGARAALVMQSPGEETLLLAKELGVAIIEVANTYSAITDLAVHWRRALRGKVIGITGSTGKTTTKNLVRDTVATKKSVVATKANQNNELGVPNTILSADPEVEVIVVEMGMRGLGQIARLCAIAKPDWGLITNVGESHLELLGTKARIAQAKGELFEALPPGTGHAFVNANDKFASLLCDGARLEERHIALSTFGAPPSSGVSVPLASSHVWAEDVCLDDEGRPQFILCAQGFDDTYEVERVACHMGLHGLHNVTNGCSAAAVGKAMGIDLSIIAKALEESLVEQGRQEILKGCGGYRIINDAYNASPDSMRAALSTLRAMPVSGKRYAVLGDMAELGESAIACHKSIGAYVAENPVDILICLGDLSRYMAEEAVRCGMEPSSVIHVSSVGEVLNELEETLTADDAVLVKASHCMELERVVEGLIH